ncbi:suppressor of SWI4 1 homolog isoform X3 [Pipistrellus kuhlii]|uniref:suppressor of SWI4 1 homolog isoform X3 n=1 Tax=Pipistrellus kuhlii TaxID=59472 RepID=UPI00174F5824|nr:suppressor of SWI4 1 homolog isoform X3 [Pipistrellus kuhlii]
MGQSGRSRHQKRARAQAQQRNLEAYAAQPHSFVFARGRAGRGVRQLSLDLRRVMEPLTATRLQIRKKNSLKDCVAVAGPLGVTHFLILSKTETNIYFKLMRLPGGPTLTFRVNKYTLTRDVVSSLRRHRMHEQQFTHPPLLVLNSFGPLGMHVKLMATMFQNLFPSINVHKVNLNTIKRCLLINYNPDSQELDFRHYSIKVVPVGASRGMKKLLQEKFPNMSRLQDISELLATAQDRGGAAGHTGGQGGEAAAEGPEAGPAGPECPAKKSLAGMKRTRAEADGDSDAEDPGAPPEADRAGQQEEEDEAEYFRQAVGEEPDEDMFPNARRRRSTRPPSKKQRLKQRRPDRGSDHRPPKAKGRPRGTQAKGPPGAVQNYGRGRAQRLKRVA